MQLQKTVKSDIHLCGVGLHSGKTIEMMIRPAPSHQGIVFVRTDLESRPQILANYKNVFCTQLATTLGQTAVGSEKPILLSTVEHVLAAFQGLGIDNAWVDVDGPELPIMDGSAQVFVESLLAAGIETQCAFRSEMRVKRCIELRQGEQWAKVEPSELLEIEGSIDWDHPCIGYQCFHYKEGKSNFQDLARARTFGFLKDAEMLKSKGLAQGASLDNAIVLDHQQVLNPQGLRDPNEFVKHKILDALGDFKLVGMSIQGAFRLHRAGHEMHYRLLNEIFKDPENYELVHSEMSSVESVSSSFPEVLLASRLAVGLS